MVYSNIYIFLFVLLSVVPSAHFERLSGLPYAEFSFISQEQPCRHFVSRIFLKSETILYIWHIDEKLKENFWGIFLNNSQDWFPSFYNILFLESSSWNGKIISSFLFWFLIFQLKAEPLLSVMPTFPYTPTRIV